MAQARLHKSIYGVLVPVAAIVVALLMPIVNSHAATSCYAQTWKQGSSGQCVKDIQNLLNYDLYKTSTSKYLSVDGDYGSYTTAAVKQEQKNSGVTQNGTVNAQTWPHVCTPGSGTPPSWYTSAATNAGCPAGTGSSSGSGSTSVTYTVNNLAATVTGTSVTATTTVAASADTTAQYAGVCVRDAAGNNFDFDKASNVVLTTAGTVLNGPAQTLAAGTYTYFACVEVNNTWYTPGSTQTFTISDSGTGTGGGTGGTGGTTPTVPFASALSGYTTLAQSYTASDMIAADANGKTWAQYADDTQEGGGTCSTSNVSYDAANDAVKLSTNGLPTNQSGATCGHIRSATTVPTTNSVIESKVWLPGNSPTTMLDWASFWTDGADANGVENWPVTGEVDAVETNFGQSFVSIHCGCMPDYNASSLSPTEVWTTEPSGWEDKDTTYATTSAPNVQPGWNVVDIAFNADGTAGIYYNGTLYVTVPASALTWNTGHTYVNWGISGAYDTFSQSDWPTGAGYEEVQYLKVFTQ